MTTKTFAQEARTLLREGVTKKLLFWGFSEKGEILEEPQKISGGYLLRGEPYDDPNVPVLWSALKSAIAKKGIEVVIEEAAYTWFNRMMAIKILAKNGYEEAQLSYVEGMQHTPVMLQRARQGNYPFLDTKEQDRLKKIISDYNKDQEAFALLLSGYCHSHNTLNRVFGQLDDYTEILLPDNMLQDRGFLHLLNTTDAISDEDYQKVELIGWLYQFYISERKDEVFASFKKNKKAEAKDIPAATQIFTPNWIVKYMVENTAGKIWLDKHPDSALKPNMKYLVENSSSSEGEVPKAEGLISNVEELTLIDPACGSGHILVEGFDLIYQMYMEEYYSPEEAVESILKNNLFGLDIDDRAAQLSNFAVLLKAAKVYPDVWTKDWLPQVYAMPEAKDFSQQELKDFLGTESEYYLEELDDALRLMKQAKNLGSVMKLKLSEEAQTYIAQRFEELKTTTYRDFNVEAVYQSIQTYIPVLLLLTKKYTSVVANPPYMGQKNMNADLKKYITSWYPENKSDLFSVFIEKMLDIAIIKGRIGVLTMESWMFLSSYKHLRDQILDNTIISLAHFGWHVIGIAFGTCSTIILKDKKKLISEFSHTTIKDIDATTNAPTYFPVKNNKFQRIEQDFFDEIPGRRIGYWLGKGFIKAFKEEALSKKYGAKSGVLTGKDALFVRNWSEVDYCSIGFGLINHEQMIHENPTWVPITNGGAYRKWYGNLINITLLKNNGEKIKTLEGNNHRLRNPAFYFREGINWTLFSSSKFCVRTSPESILFGNGSRTFFPSTNDSDYLLALFNTKVVEFILNLYNPTNNAVNEDIETVPIVYSDKNRGLVNSYSNSSLKISQIDWNYREASWDFEQSPLLNDTLSLEQAYQSWQEEVTQDFFQLHANEEELNRIFIDIYGLQDELTPEVSLKDITILQEELSKKDMVALEETFRAHGKEAIALPIDRSEVINQFISYAIGLFMGRYRLDKPGLNIAHPNPSLEELASYTHNGGQVIIDEDAILPLMGSNCKFPDDALHQIHGLLDTLWGHDTRTENINFIQECLDKDLEKFLVKDFYISHCSMYKKKPIYWLFSSKKGAFQVLVYMHRMNAFTAEKIRANYLLEHIKNLHSEETMLASNESNLSTQEARKLEQIRKDIDECEEYDMELKNVADQQIQFDLDDGVTANYQLFESVVVKIK